MKRINKTFITGMPAMLIVALVFGMVLAGCEEAPKTRSAEVTATEEEAAKAAAKKAETEEAAWEAQGINGYYLTLTHTKGAAKYDTKTLISDDSEPKFVETGSAGAAVLTKDFPFSPLAVTVPEIYGVAKDAASKGTEVEIRYDSERHFPEYVRIGDDTITVKSLEPITKSDTLEADGFDFERHDKEKAAWEALKVTSYRYTGKRVLDVLTSSVTVTVTPDSAKVIVLEEEGTENAWDYEAATISDIFEAISLMVKEEAAMATPRGETVISHIEYDATYHYPALFGVTRAKDGEIMDGGGHGIKITGFTKLTD